jgi:uracil-DNA glycosylase family 4
MDTNFFDTISAQVSEAALRAPVFQKRSHERHKWAYSICATPIQCNKGVIMGINWGGGSDKSIFAYEIQSKMPTSTEYKDQYRKGDYAFLKRSSALLLKYRGIDVSEGDFNYTNLCFFRSPTANDLSLEDYTLCIPIFSNLITSISPPWIVCLGTTVTKYIGQTCKTLTPVYNGKDSRWRGFKGTFLDVPFYCLPHPNARVKSEDRIKIWEECFSVAI